MSGSNVTDPEELVKATSALLTNALFDEGDTVLTPLAEQHYMLALAALESAKAHFTLAQYFLSRKD